MSFQVQQLRAKVAEAQAKLEAAVALQEVFSSAELPTEAREAQEAAVSAEARKVHNTAGCRENLRSVLSAWSGPATASAGC